MSAADRMVIRTRDGSYRSVPRRTGLGMISRGHAEAAPNGAPADAPEAFAAAEVDPLGPHGDEYQERTLEQVREQLAHAMGVPVEAVTPTALDDPYGVGDRAPMEFEAVRGPIEFPKVREILPEPRGNASRAEWAAYAASLGVEVIDGMTRNQIRDAAQDAAQSLDRLPQPALPGGRLETPEDEPVTGGSVTDDEDPGTP